MHDDVTQIGSLHLHHRILRQHVQSRLRKHTKVFTSAVSTCSTGPLVQVRLTDPTTDQRGQMLGRIVPLLLDTSGVDDVDDIRDRDRRLGNVSGKDDSSLTGGVRLKHLLLVCDRNGGVKDVDRRLVGGKVETEGTSEGVQERLVYLGDCLDTIQEDELKKEANRIVRGLNPHLSKKKN